MNEEQDYNLFPDNDSSSTEEDVSNNSNRGSTSNANFDLENSSNNSDIDHMKNDSLSGQPIMGDFEDIFLSEVVNDSNDRTGTTSVVVLEGVLANVPEDSTGVLEGELTGNITLPSDRVTNTDGNAQTEPTRLILIGVAENIPEGSTGFLEGEVTGNINPVTLPVGEELS